MNIAEQESLDALLVVRNVMRSKAFYVTGGPPTEDKPDVTFAAPADPGLVDHQLTIRVPDCRAAYSTLKSRGAEFLTPPIDRGAEVRCFFRDPDGHLLEISELRSPDLRR